MKITEYLAVQHNLFLEQLSFLEELKASQKLADASGLKEVVFSIARVVQKHAKLEEKLLFPELEPQLGEEMGPIGIMEFEHKEIR